MKGRERAAGEDGLLDDDATRPWGQRTEGSLATVGPDEAKRSEAAHMLTARLASS